MTTDPDMNNSPLSLDKALEQSADSVTVPKRRHLKRRPDIDTVLLAKQERAREREAIVLYLLALRKEHRKIPPGELTAAAEALSISERAVSYLMDDYVYYQVLYPKDKPVNFFIEGRGREKGRHLTKEQRRAIRRALQERIRKAKYGNGRLVDVPLPAGLDVQDVIKYARSLCALPSDATIRREIDDLLIGEFAADYALLIEGESHVRENLLPKKPNDLGAEDDVAVSDPVDLRFYVRHNGSICTTTASVFSDMNTDFIYAIRVIPKEEEDDTGTKHGKHFTAEELGLLYATGMYTNNVTVSGYYNDNASIYKRMAKHLSILVHAHGRTPHIRYSEVERPWARGKVENRNGQMKKFLSQYIGSYEKNTRNARRKMLPLIDQLMTPEELQEEMNKYKDELNIERRANKLSRKELFADRGHLPGPSLRELIRLPLPEKPIQAPVAIEQSGFPFDGTTYVPVVAFEDELTDLYLRWLSEARRTEIESRNRRKTRRSQNNRPAKFGVPLCAIKLITGWAVEVCLDGKWFKAKRKDTQKLDTDAHQQAKNGAIAILKERAAGRTETDKQEAHAEGEGTPIRHNIKRIYSVPELGQDTDSQPDTSDPTSLSGPQNADDHTDGIDSSKAEPGASDADAAGNSEGTQATGNTDGARQPQQPTETAHRAQSSASTRTDSRNKRPPARKENDLEEEDLSSLSNIADLFDEIE